MGQEHLALRQDACTGRDGASDEEEMMAGCISDWRFLELERYLEHFGLTLLLGK